MSFHSVLQGFAVSLQLLKPPVVGENISFNVIITNNEAAPKQLKERERSEQGVQPQSHWNLLGGSQRPEDRPE